jgi:hypothetical protein
MQGHGTRRFSLQQPASYGTQISCSSTLGPINFSAFNLEPIKGGLIRKRSRHQACSRRALLLVGITGRLAAASWKVRVLDFMPIERGCGL